MPSFLQQIRAQLLDDKNAFDPVLGVKAHIERDPAGRPVATYWVQAGPHARRFHTALGPATEPVLTKRTLGDDGTWRTVGSVLLYRPDIPAVPPIIHLRAWVLSADGHFHGEDDNLFLYSTAGHAAADLEVCRAAGLAGPQAAVLEIEVTPPLDQRGRLQRFPTHLPLFQYPK